jgi:hypothetical protein
MASDAVVYEETVPVEVSSLGWTGGYVGLHAGYAWGRETDNRCDFFELVPLLDVVGDRFDVDGFVGGAHVGYNWQSDNFVYGVEGDIDFADITGGSMRHRGRRSCRIPHPAFRTGDDLTRSPQGRASYQGGTVPGRHKPGQLRLHCHPEAQQDASLELARCEWIERRENVIALGPSGSRKGPCASRSQPGRMPEKPVRRLHHRSRASQSDDGGARRAASVTCQKQMAA